MSREIVVKYVRPAAAVGGGGNRGDTDLLWLIAACVVLAIVLASLGGCSSASKDESAYSPIPMTATAVDKAASHVTSADALVKQAKPTADKIGAALLDAASGEHGKAQAALVDAKGELVKASAEKVKLQKAEADEAAALATVKHGWGYRLQVIVARMFVWLCVLVAIHFVALALGLFLPPPYGSILSFIGKVVNPGGWVVAIFDHLHFVSAAGGGGAVPAQPSPVIPAVVETAAPIILGTIHAVPAPTA